MATLGDLCDVGPNWNSTGSLRVVVPEHVTEKSSHHLSSEPNYDHP